MDAMKDITDQRIVDPVNKDFISQPHQGYIKWEVNGRQTQSRVEWCPWWPGMWKGALGTHTYNLLLLFRREMDQGRHDEWNLE